MLKTTIVFEKSPWKKLRFTTHMMISKDSDASRVFILGKKRLNRKCKCVFEMQYWISVLNVRSHLYCTGGIVGEFWSTVHFLLNAWNFSEMLYNIVERILRWVPIMIVHWKQSIVWIPQIFYTEEKFKWIEFVIMFQNVYIMVSSRTARNSLCILPCNLIKSILQHECSANLLHIFQNTFS